MNVLAISTATSQLSVALKTAEEVVEKNRTDSRNHSIHLMPTIETVLKDANLKLNDLDAVVVAQGPGSYTGVRIGVTAAKTIAKVLNKKLYGLSTFALLAQNVADSDAIIVPVIDARNDNFFAAGYTYNSQNKYEEVLEPQHINFADLVPTLTQKANELEKSKLVFVGETLDSQKEKFADLFAQDKVVLEVFDDNLVHAKYATAVIDDLHEQDIDSFVPEYLRKTQAETDWAKATGKPDGDQYVEEV